MTGHSKHRVGLAGALHKQRAKRDSCTTNFYKTPTAGQTVDSSAPLTISWDASCLSDTKAVDIYLFEPSAPVPLLYTWKNADFAKGSYEAPLMPRWWNSTASVQLQLSILPAGEPLYMQAFAAAPLWTATYSAPSGTVVAAAANTAIHDNGVTNVAGAIKKTSSGGIAAAVLLPLIALIGLGAFFWVRRVRAGTKERTQRNAEQIDRRMSTISRDWSSITPAGATAAIRHSVAFSGVVGGVGMGAAHRDSAYSFRASEDVNRAGVGARAPTQAQEDMAEVEAPPAARLRPGLRQQSFAAERQSRVISFADQPRPSDVRRSLASGGRVSADTRRTVTSRAFHDGYVPPVPARADTYEYESSNGSVSGTISPTQTQGPAALSPEDIHARLEHSEMMPALSYMVQGGDGAHADSSLLPPPTPPAPTHSPIMGSMPMQPAPTHAVTSPDDLLRAYATRNNAPVQTNAYGMRVLYAPPTAAASPNPFRSSAMGSDASHYSAFANEGA